MLHKFLIVAFPPRHEKRLSRLFSNRSAKINKKFLRYKDCDHIDISDRFET